MMSSESRAQPVRLILGHLFMLYGIGDLEADLLPLLWTW